MYQYKIYQDFFNELEKENCINSNTIGELLMDILKDRDMLFDYMDTATVSVDFIDILVEKRNKMREENKSDQEIDKKIKKMIFRGCGFIFSWKMEEMLENEIMINLDHLEEDYKNDLRIEDLEEERE
jgi:uncharacterized Rmd1/YagE family protein